MKKTISIVIIFIMLLALVGCGKPKVITKEQMLTAQTNYSQKVYPIVSDMGKSYSDYMAYNKSESNFKADVVAFQARYNDIEKAYVQFNKEYQLDPKENNDKMVKAISSIELARNSIGNILSQTVKDGKVISRGDLLKMYVEQSKIMEKDLDAFKRTVSDMNSAK